MTTISVPSVPGMTPRRIRSAAPDGVSAPMIYFCFTVAALAALTGMGLGIAMGVMQDFTLAPVHAHINLLGWVTMSLYGLYHRGVPRRSNRMAWVQVLLGGLGFPAMTGGIGLHIATGSDLSFMLALAGSVGVILSMALFLIILILDMR